MCSRVAIKAGRNSGLVTVLAKLVVILDTTPANDEGISVSAVDTAELLLALLL